MHVLYITDLNYLAPTMVSMTSVCESNKEEALVFHVLYDATQSESELQKLVEVSEKYGKQCVLHGFDFSSFESSLPFGKSDMPSHCSIATYYRLFISDILPSDIDRILYLDGDVIVRGSISDLFKSSTDYVAVEGVIDNWEGDISKFNRLRYNPSFRYINAGVLLIHLDYWRNEHILEHFLNYISSNPERILHHDQDVINACLYDKKKVLPFRYNVQDGFLFSSPNFLYYDCDLDFYNDIRKPVIIHYCSSSKPWQRGCKHPYTQEYLKFMKLCNLSYGDFPMRVMSIRERIRSLLVLLGVVRENALFVENLELR